MPSLLQSTLNTRTVLPGNQRLLRSDAPLRPTEEDAALLLLRGITTLIDLRSPGEIETRPCPLQADSRFRYLHLPVTGGNALPASPDDVPRSYLRMVDDQMARILLAIREAEGVMYFCAAGKDRTGVVSALLQRAHGMHPDAIAEEYALSGNNLQGMLTAFLERRPEIDPEILIPRKEYMLQFLSMLQQHA